MEFLWAPWRMEFILKPKPSECVLCEKLGENNDEANYILLRAKNNFVIMNSWPYNPGHLMVAPLRHVAVPEELQDEEMFEHHDIVRRCLRAIRQVLNPGGFNIGMNVGKTAGAGIADHIHTHIVPRWEGDVNFMPVINDSRVVPEALASTYERLKGQI